MGRGKKRLLTIYIETQFLHSELTRTRLERDDEFASWKI